MASRSRGKSKRNPRTFRIVGAAVVMFAALGCTQAPEPADEPPRLIVSVVGDQLRADLLDQYDELFTHGLRRLSWSTDGIPRGLPGVSDPMPYYEYRCGTNGRTVEVRHGMSEKLESWGEVAERAKLDIGDTPAGAPVERLLSAPVPLTTSGSDAASQSCGSGCACYPQA